MVRFKNRWLLVELVPCSPAVDLDAPAAGEHATTITSKHVWSALKQSLIANFGDTGWGAVAASLTIKYFSPTTHVCIVRVARDQHRLAWAALTLLTAVEGRRYVPHVVHVSGTIKQAQMAAIAHNRAVVARYRARARTPASYRSAYDDFLETSTEEINALQD